MREKSAAPFLVLFKGFSIMFGLFLSQFFVFLHGSLCCTHLNFKENTAILTPSGSEVCAPRQKCATHRLLLVSAATTCSSLFLVLIENSILYPLYTPHTPPYILAIAQHLCWTHNCTLLSIPHQSHQFP